LFQGSPSQISVLCVTSGDGMAFTSLRQNAVISYAFPLTKGERLFEPDCLARHIFGKRTGLLRRWVFTAYIYKRHGGKNLAWSS
jgi:hypothetical protein